MTTDLDESVTAWIQMLQDGDSTPVSQLWNRYFEQLVKLADKKLPRGAKRVFDGEDVALSAFQSLVEGVQQNNFPDLSDRQNLWSLLVVITARKAMNRMRDATRKKRGGGLVKGHSGFGDDVQDSPAIEQIIGREPSPEFAAQAADECELLLRLLPNDDVRRVALLKLEGLSNAEAATQLQCAVRTIERRLVLIRKVWDAEVS